MKHHDCQPCLHASRRRGLSRLEVIVVTLIAVIVFACSTPAAISTREKARMTQCAKNLHQIGLALHNYHEQNKTFPPGFGRPWDPKTRKLLESKDATKPNRRDGLCWMVYLLPFMDEPALAEQLQSYSVDGEYELAGKWEVQVCKPLGDGNGDNAKPDPNILIHARKSLEAYRCPSAGNSKSSKWGFAAASYAGNLGWSSGTKKDLGYGLFDLDGRLIRMNNVTDGLTYTIAVSEAGAPAGSSKSFTGSETFQPQWIGSLQGDWRAVLRKVRHDRLPATSDEAFTSSHQGVIQVLACDGAVHVITNKVDPAVWTSLGTCRQLTSTDEALVKASKGQWNTGKDGDGKALTREVQADWVRAHAPRLIVDPTIVDEEEVEKKPAEQAAKPAAKDEIADAGLPPWVWFGAGVGTVLVLAAGILLITRRKTSAA